MNRDHKRAPHDPEELEGEAESHAADEPTAVWDESAMRAAGLTDLLNKRRSDPPPPAPATSRAGDPSIVVDQSMTSNPALAASGARAAPSARTGLGWGATLLIAIVLGALVYLGIRFLKG